MLYLSHPASYTEVLSVYLAIVRHMPYSFLCFYQSSFLHGLCSSILRFQIYKSIICIREWERDLKNKNKDHGTFLFLRRRKQPILWGKLTGWKCHVCWDFPGISTLAYANPGQGSGTMEVVWLWNLCGETQKHFYLCCREEVPIVNLSPFPVSSLRNWSLQSSCCWLFTTIQTQPQQPVPFRVPFWNRTLHGFETMFLKWWLLWVNLFLGSLLHGKSKRS